MATMRRLCASFGLIVFLVAPAQVPVAAAESVCSPDGRFCATGDFLAYWQAHGGLAVNGYPLSPRLSGTLPDGTELTYQRFERARFEYHPENAAPYTILLGQLGRERGPQRFPAFDPTPTVARAGARYFPATGHNVSGLFLAYWRAHGGLTQFGYPLTEPFMASDGAGGMRAVQCFERACFEQHPENAAPYNVLLTQLGRAPSEEH